jgi:HAD superfamily hydrolase (TIGR01457 family)
MIPSHIKALILDMDGVVWRGDAPIGDLATTFRRIRERGLKFVFATNNSTRTSEQYVDKLKSFGVDVEPWQVVTSSQAAARAMSQSYPRGTKALVIGEDGLRMPLEQQGFEIVSVENAPQAEVVVMGMDRGVSFEKLSEATLLIRKGVRFYATNMDKTFPTPRGEIPGAGAWVSVITTATNVEPIVAGKPFPFLMELSLERLGTLKEETLVVGDRLETDIAAGQAVNCPTALVLSGVSSREQADNWTPRIDVVVNDLTTLINELSGFEPDL